MKRIGLVLGAALLIAGTAGAQQLEGLVGHEERELVNKDPAKAAKGNYEIDASHVAVNGKIMHGNLAWLHFRFAPDKIIGKYNYDPARPEATRVEVSIDSAAIDFGLPNFDNRVKSAEFMDVAKFPKINFVSTQIRRTTAPNVGTMTGNLTLHGVTKPITFNVTFNGAGPAGRRVKMGYAATGQLNLADYGIDIGTNNVSGPVLLTIDVEWSSTDVETNVQDVIRQLGGRGAPAGGRGN
jgi:polyisoprenoid-binding protein YceI